MKHFLQRLLKFLAYVAACVVILLAIVVGLFRLFLPRVPEYQDEIKAWASTAIGMQVEFSGMDARWGLSGPELKFHNAELIRLDGGTRIVAAEEVRVGVGFMRLLFEQRLVVDRLVVRDTGVTVRQLDDGSYRVQGIPLNELLQSGPKTSSAPLTSIEVIGEDIELRFIRPGDQRPNFFAIPKVSVSVDDKRIAADADIRLPGNLGKQLGISATQILAVPAAERSWDILVDAEDIDLQGGLSSLEVTGSFSPVLATWTWHWHTQMAASPLPLQNSISSISASSLMIRSISEAESNWIFPSTTGWLQLMTW